MFTTQGIRTIFQVHQYGIRVSLEIDSGPSHFIVRSIEWHAGYNLPTLISDSGELLERSFIDYGADERASFVWKALDRAWALVHAGASSVTCADLGWEEFNA